MRSSEADPRATRGTRQWAGPSTFRWSSGTWVSVVGSVCFLGAVVGSAPGVLVRLGLVAWIASASLLAAVVFRVDKLRADAQDEWRVPERVLRSLSRFGGWPGAWVTMQGYRHKVRKTSFRVDFWCDAAIHMATCAGLIWLAKAVWPADAP